MTSKKTTEGKGKEDVQGWVDQLRREMNDQKAFTDKVFNDHVRDIKKLVGDIQQRLDAKDVVIDILLAQITKLQQEAATHHEEISTKVEKVQNDVDTKVESMLKEAEEIKRETTKTRRAHNIRGSR